MIEEIAQAAFSFEFLVAILATVIGLALISGGVPVPAPLQAFLLPTTKFYNMTEEIVSELPTSPTLNPITWLKVGIAASGAVLQFLWTLASGYLTLCVVVAKLLPPPFVVFSAPIIAVGAFLQFCAWYYMIKKILEIMSRFLPVIAIP